MILAPGRLIGPGVIRLRLAHPGAAPSERGRGTLWAGSVWCVRAQGLRRPARRQRSLRGCERTASNRNWQALPPNAT